MVVNLCRHLHHHPVHIEVGTIDEFRGGLGAVITRAVFGPHLIVDGLLGLLDMELAGIAVLVFTSEIVHTIRNV